MKKSGMTLAALASALFLLFWQPTTANSGLIINEVQTQGLSDGQQEFIELYNPDLLFIDLSNYTITYYISSTGTPNLVYTFPINSSLSPGYYFLLVHSGKNVGVEPDGVFTQTLSNVAGSLVLRDNSNLILDSVAWGSPNYFYGETASAPAPHPGCSITRFPEGFDTNNNSVDFIETYIPTPMHKVDAPVPIPTSVWLLGSGLLGLAGLRRFRKS